MQINSDSSVPNLVIDMLIFHSNLQINFKNPVGHIPGQDPRGEYIHRIIRVEPFGNIFVNYSRMNKVCPKYYLILFLVNW